MCSPVGHSLAALATGVTQKNQSLSLPYLFFCLFSGIAADLDFLVGWALGDINGYHHQFSHSIAAALIYGFGVYLFARVFLSRNGVALGLAGALIYFSHLVLDLLAADYSFPYGLMLWWPVSETYVISPITPFRSVQHDAVGRDMWGFIQGLFSLHNFWTVVLETVILLPVLGYCYYQRRSRLKNTP